MRVVVGGCAASLYKTFTTALAGEGKTSKLGWRPSEMHPYSRYAGLPPAGEVLAALCLALLMK